MVATPQSLVASGSHVRSQLVRRSRLGDRVGLRLRIGIVPRGRLELTAPRRAGYFWAAMPDTAPTPVSMETLVALCKRRGFIFQSSEIYGGINGFFDFGPLGVELKKNIRDCWWNDMVRRRDDIVGIETSIIMHPKVWEASGHVAGFADPLVDCKASKQRYRADQLFFAEVVVDGKTVGYVSALESERTAEALQEACLLYTSRRG